MFERLKGIVAAIAALILLLCLASASVAVTNMIYGTSGTSDQEVLKVAGCTMGALAASWYLMGRRQ